MATVQSEDIAKLHETVKQLQDVIHRLYEDLYNENKVATLLQKLRTPCYPVLRAVLHESIKNQKNPSIIGVINKQLEIIDCFPDIQRMVDGVSDLRSDIVKLHNRVADEKIHCCSEGDENDDGSCFCVPK